MLWRLISLKRNKMIDKFSELAQYIILTYQFLLIKRNQRQQKQITFFPYQINYNHIIDTSLLP